MKVIQLNHKAIYVKDLLASIHFYSKVLDLEQMPRPAFSFPGAWFKLGPAQELHLIAERKEALAPEFRSNHFALCVSSIREAEEDLKNKGITYLGPKPRPDGPLQIFIQDPDGYWIELTEIAL